MNVQEDKMIAVYLPCAQIEWAAMSVPVYQAMLEMVKHVKVKYTSDVE